jgi:glycosyltransferase involved in cell wall biosynthesis
MEMGRMDRLAEQCLYRFARFIPVAISMEVRTSVCDLYGLSNCALIRNGVEIPRETTKTGADGSCLFLSVGRLSEQKNHRMLLSAFALVRSVCPGARLEIAGEGPLRQVLEEYVQSLGLSDSIVFLGLRSDMPQLLQAADAFVLSSSYEGLSIALLEAMASGLPVVTTAVEGVNDVMTDGRTGMVVGREDTAAFAQAMVKLTQSADLRRSMGRAAREVVQSRYSIVRQVDEYVRLLGLA